MKKRILFVCQGNICRSPSAEAIFNEKVKRAGLSKKYSCDSAGTIAYHSGEAADARMQQYAIKRGYKLNSISRKINANNDFDAFDLIIAMDDENLMDLQRMARGKGVDEKIFKMTDFCSPYEYESVPDPYYGGGSGFELVLDLLENACDGLISHLKHEG